MFTERNAMTSPLARFYSLILLAAAAAFAVTAAQAQETWNYKSYIKDRNSGQYFKDKFVTSTVSVTEKDGKAMFRMITSGKGDPCISAYDLPAEVERSAETTTVTVTPTLAGCEPFRYVIKNDGSGGVRLSRRNEQWVSDGFDHDLTPKK
jgi:hypothetical protein